MIQSFHAEPKHRIALITRRSVSSCLVATACLLLASWPAFGDEWTSRRSVVFADESAEVVGEAGGPWQYDVTVVTREGLQPAVQRESSEERLAIAPLGTGIHIVQLRKPVEAELRFLALRPPGDGLDISAVRERLPRFADKLLTGEPVTIVATGDSVTATGDYPLMLSMLLERLTGNENIEMVTAAYPGTSADATVRNWEQDIAPHSPDLVLVMFGLNDQAAWVPRQAYLEHHRWMAERVRQSGGEILFLQPTPVASDEKDPAGVPVAIRTAVLAHALSELGSELSVPVAQTFDALWGAGDPDPARAAAKMRPLFPPHYKKRFASAAESGTKLDSVHPNALGHAAIADAVLAAMFGQTARPPWSAVGESMWTDAGVVSRLTFRSDGDTPQSGSIGLIAPPHAELETESWRGNLDREQEVTLNVRWKQARAPHDLLTFPMDRYLAQAEPVVIALVTSGERTTVQVVEAPFVVKADVLDGRQVTGQPNATVRIRTNQDLIEHNVSWPGDQEVGRLPIVEEVEAGGGATGWAVGELAYLRVPAAAPGETVVDGNLAEWQRADWTPLDDLVQARWTKGPERLSDDRTPVKLEMAVRAGATGVGLAFRFAGDPTGHRFTVWFDPRVPEALGTVGTYFWISGTFPAADRVQVKAGSSSPRGVQPQGVVGDGTLEIFVPYGVMAQEAWPDSGDLGLSVHWRSTDTQGEPINQLWADDGHPWNPRWFGVVQRDDGGAPPRRYRVRVE